MTDTPARQDDTEAPIVVLKCGSCGDVFPTVTRAVRCPSCGSTEVDVAAEPLL